MLIDVCTKLQESILVGEQVGVLSVSRRRLEGGSGSFWIFFLIISPVLRVSNVTGRVYPVCQKFDCEFPLGSSDTVPTPYTIRRN